MRNVSIIAWVCLACCMSKSREQLKPVYDQRFLKMFVLSTSSIDRKDAGRLLDSIIQQSSQDNIAFRQTISYLEIPFSNPNSVYRNEHLYLKLLQAQLRSHYYNTYEKEIVEEKLKLLQQNNVGYPANDFNYITPTGYKQRMYDIQASFTLIYFNNPECSACKEMKKALAESPIINKMLQTGELKILAMYTDKDERLWLEHLNEYPEKWIRGRDEDEYLYKNKVYDLKAIPSLYLLNVQKIVLLKDGLLVEAVEDALKIN